MTNYKNQPEPMLGPDDFVRETAKKLCRAEVMERELESWRRTMIALANASGGIVRIPEEALCVAPHKQTLEIWFDNDRRDLCFRVVTR